MERSSARVTSHLFLVRVWLEEVTEGEAEWRGRIQHVASGEACYFREWPRLPELMLSILTAAEAAGDPLSAGGRKKEEE